LKQAEEVYNYAKRAKEAREISDKADLAAKDADLLRDEDLAAEKAKDETAEKAKDETAKMAKEDETAKDDAEKVKDEATKAKRARSIDASIKAKKTEAIELKAEADALLYAATYSACRLGVTSERRLGETASQALKHPKVREVLQKFPEKTLRPERYNQFEIPTKIAQEIIRNFLETWLGYDPIEHVKSAQDKVDTKDPERVPLDQLKSKMPAPRTDDEKLIVSAIADKETYNTFHYIARNPSIDPALAAFLKDRKRYESFILPLSPDSPLRLATEIVPPQDSYHRWAFFTEVNFEEIRSVCESLYAEKPDLDWTIALWDYFEGEPAKVDEWFTSFCRSHQDSTPSALKVLEFGGWSMLGDFKKNLDRVEFYNKNTEVLRRILDRHAEDKKIGAELMKHRVRKEKAKNIKEEGPDDPNLVREYCRTANTLMKSSAAGLGAEKVITQEEMRRLEKTHGDLKAAKELEYLDQWEKIRTELIEIKKNRPLKDDEKKKLAQAEEEVIKAKQMIEVPENAIQVDVFETNATGMTKKTFFTESEETEIKRTESSTGAGSSADAGIPASAKSKMESVD
jgi:hypothetical protein